MGRFSISTIATYYFLDRFGDLVDSSMRHLMFKFNYSRKDHVLLFDFSRMTDCGGELSFRHMVGKVRRALGKIRHGYTLVEVFRDRVFLPPQSLSKLASLYSMCYSQKRVWRVVQVLREDVPDPGIRILRRIRWNRDVPAVEVENVRQAVSLAREEIGDNFSWIGQGC